MDNEERFNEAFRRMIEGFDGAQKETEEMEKIFIGIKPLTDIAAMTYEAATASGLSDNMAAELSIQAFVRMFDRSLDLTLGEKK